MWTVLDAPMSLSETINKDDGKLMNGLLLTGSTRRDRVEYYEKKQVARLNPVRSAAVSSGAYA